MNIVVSNESKLPIYEQLKEQIKNAIFNEEIAEGEPLPSIRVLARDLRLSVITTMRAYNELENEGYVVNVQGKGCFVKPRNPELIREKKLKETEELLRKAIVASRVCGVKECELIEMLKILYGGERNE